MTRRRRTFLAWAILGAIAGGLAFLFLIGTGLEPPFWLAVLLIPACALLAALIGPRFGPPKMEPPDVGV